ncbi:MAG: outer membrane protein assembly factor BamE [Gammaproteobacteria bacterium]|nr:outer membrane protein assembly factor BamE [Gammaproteobacteria bacterium]
MAKLSAFTILALLFVNLGCVYKQNVYQGNPISADDIAEVEVGMTRSQVKFLLGTPMIADPFHQDRWDYIYYYRDGKTANEFRRHFAVYFENNVVIEIKERDTDS